MLRMAFLGACVAFASAAQSATIDFSSDSCATPCSSGQGISQSFGDTGQVDVTYDDGAGNSMYFWNTGYSGLTGVAYGSNGASSSITLREAKGYKLTLRSLALGAWISERVTSIRILNGVGDVLYDSGDLLVPQSTGTVVSGKWRAKKGLVIDFGPDSFNVGIDQITYRIKAKDAAPALNAHPTAARAHPGPTKAQPLPSVPLPAGLPLLLAGLGALGGLRILSRRRS